MDERLVEDRARGDRRDWVAAGDKIAHRDDDRWVRWFLKFVGSWALLAFAAALMPDRGDQAWFYAQLTKNASFAYLQRRASPALVEQVNAIGEPALVFARETQRLYPQSTMAAHALGFLSTDGHGMSGMERVLDARLTDPTLAKTPVALSIDARVQAAMESELGRAMTTIP